jgi:UDP-glucose 4-epimerase
MGYIGQHVLRALQYHEWQQAHKEDPERYPLRSLATYQLGSAPAARGRKVLVIDSLENVRPEAVKWSRNTLHVGLIHKRLEHMSVLNLRELLQMLNVRTVIHMAALKSGPESVRDPFGYFGRNQTATWHLLEASKGLVEQFVYSSSAAVYASSPKSVGEDAAIDCKTPYAL